MSLGFGQSFQDCEKYFEEKNLTKCNDCGRLLLENISVVDVEEKTGLRFDDWAYSVTAYYFQEGFPGVAAIFSLECMRLVESSFRDQPT